MSPGVRLALGASVLLALATLGLAPPREEPAAAVAPIEDTSAPTEDARHHAVELSARLVDLDHLGVHTHANWVVFDLPFDVMDPRVRHVRFSPRTTVSSDVGAIRIGPLCVRAPATGGVDDPRWTKLTLSGGAGTRPFWEWGGDVPHASGRTLVVSVPSRVANAAACGIGALKRRETWRLGVAWDTP